MKLHAVRQFRQCVIAGEIADAALGALAIGDVARDEYASLELRIITCDLRTCEGDRNRLAVSGAHDGFAGLLRRLVQVKSLALALIEHGADRLSDQFLL